MIEFCVGNILDAEAEALVNSVNCVGVMGRGIALQFKKVWPDNFKAYAAACRRGEVQPGRLFVFETGRLVNPRYIINFPTKRHWRSKSRMEDIEVGLRALVQEVVRRHIRSIAIPPLGCGLGGLDWEEVRPRIVQAFQGLPDVRVLIYEPAAWVVAAGASPSAEPVRMTVGRAALVALVDRYLNGLLVPFVSLLEIHKLLYFLQEAGEPLRLRFKKAPYGPYAENLRHVLHSVEGHFLSGYGDGGDDPRKAIRVLPSALPEARNVLLHHPDTLARVERVGELVEGFESPHGLELLATVHWLGNKELAPQFDDQELVSLFYRWAGRKRTFTERQVRLAARVLRVRGWL